MSRPIEFVSSVSRPGRSPSGPRKKPRYGRGSECGGTLALHRRDCIGELIQIDGSQHWWFEGRGPQCTLLVYIDDATSRLMPLQFVETELTFDYFEATRAYLDRYGKPIVFYLSWPRFFWTPHCPLKPKRNGRHEGQFA